MREGGDSGSIVEGCRGGSRGSCEGSGGSGQAVLVLAVVQPCDGTVVGVCSGHVGLRPTAIDWVGL